MLVLASLLLLLAFLLVGVKRQNFGWIVLPFVACGSLLVSLVDLDMYKNFGLRGGINDLSSSGFHVRARFISLLLLSFGNVWTWVGGWIGVTNKVHIVC